MFGSIVLIGLLPLMPGARADRLLLDTGATLSNWHGYNGGEFPGATVSVDIAEDPQRGQSVHGVLRFGGDSRYGGVQWVGRLDTAQAVGFWVKLSDRTGGMLRVRDATDQEHAGSYAATPGQWVHNEIPLEPGSFGAHWGGANDGVLHFPLKAVLIAIGRGPDSGELLVSDLYAEVDRITPAERWGITVQPDCPSGVALRSEPVTYEVRVANRVQEPAAGDLVVSVQEGAAEGTEVGRCRVDVPAWGEQSMSLPLPTGRLGYRRITARMHGAAGEVMSETVSGLAVVPRPRHYQKAAPDGYFGMQHITDMEAAERLGCKAVRLGTGWRWAEPNQGRVMWEDMVDPVVASGVQHQMTILMTMEAIAPEWISWQREDKPGVAGLPDPARLDEWEQFVRSVVARHRGKFAAMEIQNEPDLTCWVQPGLSFEEGVDYYVKLLRAAHRGAKSADPDLPIAGIDVSGGDFDTDLRFTRAVLAQAADCLDLYTGHPYASPRYFGPGMNPMWPMENRIPEKCREALDLVAEHGRPRRMWIGELGWGLQETADPLGPYSLDFAACIAQALIVGKTEPGVEKFLYFTLRGCNEDGNEYGLLRGQPAYPLPAATAYAAAAYALDATDAGELTQAAGGLWRASFVCHDRDELVVAWWTDGEPARVRPPADAPQGRWLDSFLQVLRPGEQGVAVGRLPVYWTLPLAQTGARPEFLEQLSVGAAVPLVVRGAYLSHVDRLCIEFSNRTTEALQVTVKAADATARLDVPASAEPVVRAMPVSIGPSAPAELPVSILGPHLEETLRIRGAWTPLRPLPAAPRIDGTPDPGAARLVIDTRSAVLPPDPTVGWDGPQDLSLTAHLAADLQGLYFCCEVTDDVHHVQDTGPFWSFDSLQLAIDPNNDSLEGFGEDDREIGLALTQAGPRVHQTHPPGPDLQVPVVIERRGTLTTYEVFLPWEQLSIAPPVPGQIMATNFIANENDGNGRAYWMGPTPGIGEGKSPRSYRQFAICD